MLIKGIDFPEQLLQAQQTGDLVVFAGAGVSAPAPSSLPLFTALAEQIGGPSGELRKQGEPDERYLGRLKKAGVHVHEAAAQILVNSRTKPHELHRLLGRLFPTPEKLRVVTTNFDTHFSTASQEIFGSGVDVFYAPALPLGGDFAGLVYLHGCAGKDALRCVLTDEDFGRAYLTQGWASRFLAGMFLRYSILFVGYSYNDAVMSYLTRGLPPTGHNCRFVLTTDDAHELEKWRFLEIKPLTYKRCSEENAHQAISISVGEWVRELSLGLIERGERIRSIAESQPPLEGEDSDYIEFSLRKLPTARVFLKWAKRPEWISWLERKGFLQPLFTPHAAGGDLDCAFAFWLTDYFLVDNAPELLALIQRNGGRLHPQIAWGICRRLCRRNHDSSVDGVFSRWIAVLLSQPHDIFGFENWTQLLASCRFPEDKTVSILLFDFLTKPRVLRKGPWPAPPAFDASIDVGGKLNLDNDLDHCMAETWKNLIKPNLREYAPHLEPIIWNNLASAHGLLQIYRRLAPDYDPLYFHRQSIERPNDNGFEKNWDLLVNVARDIVCDLLDARPQQAHALLERCFESNVPIFQRLAGFGLGMRADISPDEKLHWLLRNNLIYRFKTDVFQFLQRCYGGASDEAKSALIVRGLEGPKGERFAELEERTRDYEIYNLFVWLKRVAPGCALTKKTLDALHERHPDFSERERPELGYWFGGVQSVDPCGGLNPAEVGARTPEQVLDEIQNCAPRTPFERSPASYCSAVAAAVAMSPEWGISWVQALSAKKLAGPVLWECVCQGWREAKLTPEQWRLVLNLVETVEAPAEFLRSFVDVLDHGSRREQNALPEDQMEQAQRVAERIWSLALDDSSPVGTPVFKDWLSTSINEPGGKIAEFWLQRISVCRKQAAGSWKGLPPSIGNSLVSMLQGKSRAAAMARVVFASQFHYFLSLDASFAREIILPVFDWNIDPLRAEQSWHGFLFWGRWVPASVDLLLPHFTPMVDHIGGLPKEVRAQFVCHIATVAIFCLENPLEDNWMSTLLQKLEDRDREELAEDFDHFLRDANPAIAEGVWERWFKKYWEMRLHGLPRPLLPKEANAMVVWPLGFGKYFPEAVRLALRLPSDVRFDHVDLFVRLKEKDLASIFPRETADLVLFVLESKPRFFHLSDGAQEVWLKLKSGGVPQEKLKSIREAMLVLGADPEAT
jgi:Domain of unknown function (DUF4020)/SIR2-like domain